MTSIEWTRNPDGSAGASWNYLAGCSVVSPGCTNCYAMRQAARIARMSPDLVHYQGLTQPSKAGPVWTGRVFPAGFDKLVEPIRRQKPQTYFVNSMSDLFHASVDRWTIARVWAVMLLTRRHTYQVLTKRSTRMREIVSDPAFIDAVLEAATTIMGAIEVDRGKATAGIEAYRALRDAKPGAWPLQNVWLGVSAEDQPRADERVPDVLATPAAVRWVSAEPLLGLINMPGLLFLGSMSRGGVVPLASRGYNALDWVVVGGESGLGARRFDIGAALVVVDDCAAAGVPCFVKQLGACPVWADGTPMILKHRKGADPTEWPESLRVQQMPRRPA